MHIVQVSLSCSPLDVCACVIATFGCMPSPSIAHISTRPFPTVLVSSCSALPPPSRTAMTAETLVDRTSCPVCLCPSTCRPPVLAFAIASTSKAASWTRCEVWSNGESTPNPPPKTCETDLATTTGQTDTDTVVGEGTSGASRPEAARVRPGERPDQDTWRRKEKIPSQHGSNGENVLTMACEGRTVRCVGSRGEVWHQTDGMQAMKAQDDDGNVGKRMTRYRADGSRSMHREKWANSTCKFVEAHAQDGREQSGQWPTECIVQSRRGEFLEPTTSISA